MIDVGKVHHNGQRGKPSKQMELNAEITLRQGNDTKTIIVLGLSTQRRSAEEAQKLYQETGASIASREKISEARKMNAMPHPDRRPDKKERRNLIKFKYGDSE